MNITLKELHALLYDAYAVSVNDDLYFIATDGNGDPLAYKKSAGRKFRFAEVDGDIVLNCNGAYTINFYIKGEPIELMCLEISQI